jgi:uncharacterized LabA/DUF88 family protein
MTSIDSTPNIAIFCDFENVAIGVRDAKHEAFDAGLVLARLLDKGKVIVKKAYSDWERYKSSKRPMHEAGFELIEVPHVSYSGKNSADIRLVVDALDMCYTKTHIDVFVIISGDSDFAPLAAKLRENNKTVVGLGVKSSTSDLFVDHCDEFIYYDDLLRETKKEKAVKSTRTRSRGRKSEKAGASALGADHTVAAEIENAAGREEAIDLVTDTIEALMRDRSDPLWGSMVKQTLKRKRPSFAESFYGYKSFNQLLEDARDRGLLELKKDDKSGGYVILGMKQPV